MFKKILEKIKEYNRIIIHHHIRPDGDCIGSQMGMKHLIKATYPEKEVYAVGGDVPPYLEYIAFFLGLFFYLHFLLFHDVIFSCFF